MIQIIGGFIATYRNFSQITINIKKNCEICDRNFHSLKIITIFAVSNRRNPERELKHIRYLLRPGNTPSLRRVRNVN